MNERSPLIDALTLRALTGDDELVALAESGDAVRKVAEAYPRIHRRLADAYPRAAQRLAEAQTLEEHGAAADSVSRILAAEAWIRECRQTVSFVPVDKVPPLCANDRLLDVRDAPVVAPAERVRSDFEAPFRMPDWERLNETARLSRKHSSDPRLKVFWE